MTDQAAMPDDLDAGNASFREALQALERARTGQGSVVVIEAWAAGGAPPRDVLDTMAGLAQADRWGVARAVGAELARARPLALVRRLLVACGGMAVASESVHLTAARLRGTAMTLAAASPAGCALVVVDDAQLASRACLRTLGELGETLADVPVVLALGFAHPREGLHALL